MCQWFPIRHCRSETSLSKSKTPALIKGKSLGQATRFPELASCLASATKVLPSLVTTQPLLRLTSASTIQFIPCRERSFDHACPLLDQSQLLVHQPACLCTAPLLLLLRLLMHVLRDKCKTLSVRPSEKLTRLKWCSSIAAEYLKDIF